MIEGERRGLDLAGLKYPLCAERCGVAIDHDRSSLINVYPASGSVTMATSEHTTRLFVLCPSKDKKKKMDVGCSPGGWGWGVGMGWDGGLMAGGYWLL